MLEKGAPVYSKRNGSYHTIDGETETTYLIGAYHYEKSDFQTLPYFKLKCIDAERTNNSLTPNKTYVGWNERHSPNYDFTIVNDRGLKVIYKHDRFKVLEAIDNNKTTKKEDKKGTTKMGNTTDAILGHAFHGVKVGAAAEASELVLDIVKPLVGDNNILLATEEGRQLTKLLAASGLLYLCQQKDTFIPQAEHVGAACGMVIEASARDLIQPHMGDIRTALEKLAASAVMAGKDKLADLTAPRVSVPEFVRETVPVEHAVPVGVR